MSIKISFTASQRPEAQEALQRLSRQYGQYSEEEAEVIVALGGDGSMLNAMRRRFDDRKPVYGMNRGTVGFLMNDYVEDKLVERLNKAEKAMLVPLRMVATDVHGEHFERLAINEVSLFRETAQSAKLRIRVDGNERMTELTCDGIMVATPAGSTAYNLSAHGPILPIGANLLALTPVSAFRPRRWRGALLRHDARVEFEIVEPNRRPVSAAADNQEVRDIAKVTVTEDRSKPLTMLFDPGHALDERILREQFSF
ncbi:NAD kinase [Henriciella barbarensis]|uniref:NAD kinase n=1 Tax=Henriciella barbarensis TaxID=86342 RepID=A0A399R925_9PROT|nr:NAD kinase [Henriciella barbarensis]RIJ26172.1 NAD kinase [Henriciella barbarensis]